MRVALVCPSRLPVATYGGTERVVMWLARGLIARGFDVVLVAASGSRLPQVPVVPVSRRRIESPSFDADVVVPKDVDLIHYFMPVHRPPSRPYVETLEGNLRVGETPRPHTIYVSRNHAVRYGGDTFVYNGLDPSDYAYQAVKAEHLLFLGRLHRIKGYREAIRIASACRVPLVVAGGFRPFWRPGTRYVGAVGGERKIRHLAAARALLAPIQWEEPFGLTVIEALVSGTPVIGTARGALPELVTPEVGALGASVHDLAAAVTRIHQWDPAACRSRVLREFTHLHMADAYAYQYTEVLDRGVLAPNV